MFVIAGDGDLQEGVTAEAGSLAGHQQLGNLIAIYDSNQISIEDDTNVAFTEDVQKRYEAYGWQVQTVDWKKTGEYVEDVAALYDAIEAGTMFVPGAPFYVADPDPRTLRFSFVSNTPEVTRTGLERLAPVFRRG